MKGANFRPDLSTKAGPECPGRKRCSGNQGFRPRGRLRTELPDQGIGVAVVVSFPARHGTRPFAATGFAAVFEEEDRRRAQEGEIAGEERIANRTEIFALRGIAPVVLTGLDPPVAAHLLQQPCR